MVMGRVVKETGTKKLCGSLHDVDTQKILIQSGWAFTRTSKRIGDLIDIAFGVACIFSFNLDWIE
jgi:hypothetical protein